MTEWRDASARSYLLGLLPDAQAAEVEDAYLHEPEALAHLRAAEDDLLDDYAAGRLGATEKSAFEARYLASPILRRRVEAARALRLASRPSLTAAPRLRAALALAAVLLLAVAASLGWHRYGGGPAPVTPPPQEARLGRPTPAPASPSAAPTGGPTPTSRPSPSVGRSPGAPLGRLLFALSPTLLRGNGSTTEIRLPADATEVTFDLGGDLAGTSPHAALAATVETVEGRPLWSGPVRRSTQAGRAALAIVPAGRLAPGDYLLTLTSGGQPWHRYFFRVLHG